MKSRYQFLIIIFAVILLTTTLLETGMTGGVCTGPTDGCVVVKNSAYSSTFGVSNTHLGLLASTIIIILLIVQLRNPSKRAEQLIRAGVSVIALFALYFIYLQFFVINAICLFCMVVDTLSILAAIMLWYPKKYKKK